MSPMITFSHSRPKAWFRVSIYLWLWTALFFSVATLSPDVSRAETHDTPLNRWAIVSSKPVQETGLSDLVFAAMSDRGNIELVERDQLQSATTELEINSLYGAKAVANRLHLGKRLKADALVLLSLVEHENKRFVKLAISDCNFGARLSVAHFSYSEDQVESISKQCMDEVEKTAADFASGIKHLIGVTDFLSKNLTHDYDHLQSGYAALLADSMSTFPGVAIVEIDEARAIGKELALGGENVARHVVPLFVEGEFEMSAATADSEPTVQLSIRVSDGKQVCIEGERSGLTMSQVTDLLIGRFPKYILQLAEDESGTPISRKQQSERLAARAARFSMVGAYEHAISLREAALLLQDNADERIALVRDYDANELAAKFRFELALREGRDSWDEHVARTIARFHIVAWHIERLVCTRAVNPVEASAMFSDAARWITRVQLTSKQSPAVAAIDKPFWRIFSQLHELDTAIESRFLVNTFFSMRDSERIKMRPEYQFNEWTGRAIHFITITAPIVANKEYPNKRFDDTATLDNLYRFLAKYEPSSKLMPRMAFLLFSNEQSAFNGMLSSGRFEAEEIRRFCERLVNTDRPVLQYYGRCGLLSLRTYAGRETLDGNVLNELNALLQETSKRDPQVFPFGFAYSMRKLRDDIQKRLRVNAVKKQHKLPTDLIPADSPCRLSFEPLDIDVADWRGLIKCHDELDIMWSTSRLYAMRKPGVVEKVYELLSRADSIQQVVWDGENLWLATTMSGVHLVTPAGKILARLDQAQGLPPYEHDAPTLQPMDVDRCLVVGRYSKQKRMWLGAMKFDGSAINLKIFHTATQQVNSDRSNIDEPETVFDLAWIYPYDAPLGRMLLVGRKGRVPRVRPLVVNPQSLSVEVFDLPIGFIHTPIADVSQKLFLIAPNQCDVFTRDKENDEWSSRTAFDNASEGYSMWASSSNSKFTLAYGEWLYHPGRTWHRINRKTAEVESLGRDRLPYRYFFRNYAVSAHYGLVAWNEDDQLYRVHVHDELQSSNAKSEWHNAHIPAPHRDRHAAAVKAIENLGGRVDSIYGVAPHGVEHFVGHGVGTGPGHAGEFKAGWRTVVFLPAAWKGSNEELRHLAVLHNLCAVMLFGAKISNEGMKHIGRLPNLDMLLLVETKVTNVGLEHLKDLQRLACLRLEGGGNGDEFSNEGLRYLDGISSLLELDLYGPGFNDDGVAPLQLLTGLRRLHLYNTEISKDGIAKIKTIQRHRYFQTHEHAWQY